MAVGWRPLDIDASFLPFVHSVGCQVALSDPVFMAAQGLEPHTDADAPEFPYDPRRVDELSRSGDARTKELMRLAGAWGGQAVNGVFRTWEDVRFLRKNWEGPVVVKGIMSVEDAEIAVDEGLEGIIVSNHGASTGTRFYVMCSYAEPH